ncbi:MAG: methylmalonyl Co-A mutase-associated GTPase MeaB [Bacteroidota bacterium]
MKTDALYQSLRGGDIPALARALTIVENELEGSEKLLTGLQPRQDVPVIGLTGPPGAGKSTLINALIREHTATGKRLAILAVDPTSPFNYGSLLGDRLRMAEHFTNPSVFIRSVATRGSLGGLSEKVIELIDVLRSAPFDLILVETVGVGQSEVEIAGLADTTIVLVVPESGDEVQTMKSGIMEIADIFVVNKSDREGADTLVNSLQQLTMHSGKSDWQIPVLKTSASNLEGIVPVIDACVAHRKHPGFNEKRYQLLAEKAYRLIGQRRMRGIHRMELLSSLKKASNQADFNLYRFIEAYG